jgi:hypothetical protein
MKVQKRVLDVDTTLQGERVGMTIDDSALAHIMSVLTDLYSDPEMAIIREYSTNALDAHVEAGVTRPIEVTTPTPLSPFLRIRDYGVGLDADGIREIYSRYGTSTKRSSNDVVGMLGLGCKSALTYTDQFTLTGIKDGRMVQVSVSRDEDGAGSMTIVADEATALDNGVEVVIPVKRSNAIESKATRFFSFWEKDTVLLNGVRPARIGESDGIWLDDRLLISTEAEQSTIVMGNVPYPWPDDVPGWSPQGSSYYSRPNVVAWVDIGDVAFTPSRESLQVTKQVRERLGKINKDVQEKLNASIEKQIAGASSASEAQRLLREGRAAGFNGTPIYDGREVVLSLTRSDVNPYPDDNNKSAYLVLNRAAYRHKANRTHHIELDSNYTWFNNFDHVALTPYKRQKLDIYVEQQGITLGSRLVFVDELRDDEEYWLNGHIVLDWNDVEAIKVPKDAATASKNDGRPRGSYDGRQDGTWQRGIQAETIDTSKPILWQHGNEWGVKGNIKSCGALIPDNATVIALAENRIGKFKRDFPTAQRIWECAKVEAEKWLNGLSEGELRAIQFARDKDSWLRSLKPEDVDDPAIKDAIQLANAPRLDAKLEKYYHACRYGEAPKPKKPLPAYHNRYPLLQSLQYVAGKDAAHVAIYLNAAYAAERGS